MVCWRNSVDMVIISRIKDSVLRDSTGKIKNLSLPITIYLVYTFDRCVMNKKTIFLAALTALTVLAACAPDRQQPERDRLVESSLEQPFAVIPNGVPQDAQSVGENEHPGYSDLPFDPEADFIVRLIDGGTAVEITGYTGTNTNLRIPPQIQGLPVAAIAEQAFLSEHWTSPPGGGIGDWFIEGRPPELRLTSVTIPDTVRYIGAQAFRANLLTSISLPAGIMYIGDEAFRRNELASIVIPENITHIGNGVFAYNQLVSAAIHDGVTHIGDEAFRGNGLTSVAIPDSVTHIGDEAFDLNRLTSVAIPDSVTHLGVSAFARNRLETIAIPISITHIPDRLFSGNHLSSVAIPNNITHIGNGAFWGNRMLDVTIPNSVAHIGEWAFMNNKIASITIPDGVIYIGSTAFLFNEITRVSLPDSVTYIGRAAFDNRVMVLAPTVVVSGNFLARPINDGAAMEITGYAGTSRDIEIPSHIHGLPVTLIGYYALRGGERVGGQFGWVSYNLRSVIIPDTVTHIGEGAFSGSTFSSITLPDSLIHIGDWAFEMNPNLASVIIPPNVTHIGMNAFFRNRLTSVVIPQSVAFIDGGAFASNQLRYVIIPNRAVRVFPSSFDSDVTIIIGEE